MLASVPRSTRTPAVVPHGTHSRRAHHLQELESEAIFVMREVAAQFERPALLFSGGKDSIVMVHLARKAFWPGKFPFPLLHIDTGHNFPEALEYRDWLVAENQRMDAMIVVEDGKATCRKLRDLKAGTHVVVGMRGIRVIPESKERDRMAFSFMSNGISSERQVETAVRQTAALMEATRESGKKIVVVAGPVVVHTGGTTPLAKLIRAGWVNSILSGNALAVHDIEASLFGTSLGIRQTDGRQEEHGHRNHMRAINAVNHAGSIGDAVHSGRLQSGIMYECVKAKVPVVLAGSLRDDGPLPDTITDMNMAQDAYAHHLRDAGLVLCLSSMLHSIASGNMLPSWVKVVCVDINPAVATKVSDRGTGQAVGVVTDVGLFLDLLARVVVKD